MMSLEEVKEIIRRAASSTELAGMFMEIDSLTVFEEGWEHLGEDYFYNRSHDQVAGPRTELSTRALISLSPEWEEPAGEAFDISERWERQVDLNPPAAADLRETPDKEEPQDRELRAGEICGCDV